MMMVLSATITGRRHGGAMFSVAILLILLSLLQNVQSEGGGGSDSECTSSDYTATYTECSQGVRHLIWYWKPLVNCSGGVSLPSNVYNLPCEISCGEGEYLPFGAQNCSACPVGQFSIGGGYRVEDWGDDWNSLLSFTTYCTNSKGEVIANCPGWVPDAQTQQFIGSGEIADGQRSVLELPIQLVTDGQIHFEYRVSAEPKYDGLTFKIDGDTKLELVSNTRGYATFKISLPKGYYVLTWVYSKDFSLSQGDDAAYLRMVEVGGLTHAVSSCTPCAPGTYADQERQEDCLRCQQDFYTNATGSAVCLPCPANQYAYPGSVGCTTRLPCTPGDYEAFYTPCDGYHRTQEYRWKSPIICDNSTVTLPDNSIVECAPCNPGTYRSNVTFNCTSCPVGSASSAGSKSCSPCPQGTAAVKGRYFTQWNEFEDIVTTGCDGDCGYPGWRLLGTRADSGVGHGTAESWLQIQVNIETSGSVSFNSSLMCQGSCNLEFTDEGYTSKTYYSRTQFTTIALKNGTHTLRWTFNKLDSSSKYPNDRAEMYSVIILGTRSGGSGACTTCTQGMFSTGGTSYCSPCPVGQQASINRTECVLCPGNTFNPTAGEACMSCGHGTSPTPSKNDCDTNGCTFSPQTNITFDLSALVSHDEMYGPIYDQHKMVYYLNICSKEHHNHTCYDEDGSAIASFACQITNWGWGVDLGSVIGFYPLASDPTSGLIVNFDRGTPACGNAAKGIPDVPRTANVTLYCDPIAGIGSPTAPSSVPIEGPPCHYNFAWRSLYGCPICSTRDYSFELSECRNGYQKRVYYWKNNPRRCHDGVQLPADETIACTLPTIDCPAGQFLAGSSCTDCPVGTFSVGGGYEYGTWEQWPEGFVTSCEGSSCTDWTSQNHSLLSGYGKSMLTYNGIFAKTGSVSFLTKVYAHKGAEARLEVYIDDVLQLTLDSLLLDYTWFEFPVYAGAHSIKWIFYTDIADDFHHAYLRQITILGTSLAATQCTPCPFGTYSNTNRTTTCDPCPLNTFSIGGASTCTPCPTNQYSLEGSNICAPQVACTLEDYQALFTPCNSGVRTKYWVALDPKICKGGVTLPRNQTSLSCPTCSVGSQCNPCTEGYYYDGSSCTKVHKGSAVIRTATYFVNETNQWDAGWTTNCSGSCGSKGWRIRGSYIDSGFHGFDADTEVDSYLQTVAEFINDGYVSFDYSTPQNPGGKLQFFVNGTIRMNVGYSSGVSNASSTLNLPAGVHTLTWNYHQSATPLRDIVQVSNVKFYGYKTGISVARTCSPGTFSERDGAEQCQKCDPGSFSAAFNSTTCTKCPTNEFAANSGSTRCLKCGSGTYTDNPGSAQCYTTCVFTDQDSNTAYSLVGLAPLQVQDSHDNMYHISICSPFNDNTCADQEETFSTYICLADYANNAVDFGNILSFQAGEIPSKGFTLSFTNGESRSCLQQRSTTISFVCDPDVALGSPQLISASGANMSSPCDATFIWPTIYGCPVCGDADYETVEGNCVDGQKTIAYIRSSECNGPATKVGDITSCNAQIKFPVTAVIIVGIAVLVVVIVAIVVFVNNRRLKHRYDLLNESVQKNVELENVEEHQ